MAPTKEQQDAIRWATSTLGARQADHRLHRDYYAGKQKLMISDDRLEKVFRGLFKEFRLNLCGAVVDSLADRLQIQSFSAGETEAADALEIWKRNRMHRRAGHVHLEAIASGDSYAIVWPNANDRAVIYPNRPTDVCVEYDPESPGKLVRAAKLWKERNGNEATHRLTLYYPDRIEKYETPTKSELAGSAYGIHNWRERIVEGEAWPLPNPYGQVPVFHFANNADLGEYGVSELADGVPVQDALNKSVLDMLVNGEFMAYPQRYALNIEVRRDAQGNPINPFKAGPERVWVLNGGEATQMGQFAAADIVKMDEVARSWSLRMAQVTQTPPHYFMLPGGLVSGESQKTAEQKLDAKVTDRQISFGDTWADLMALAVRMERGMASDGLELDTNWKNTKPRNEMETWQIAEIKARRGVPNEQLLIEQGYEQKQIDQWKEDNGGALGQESAAAVPGLDPALSTNGDRR